MIMSPPVYVFARGGTILVQKEKVRKSAIMARNETGFNMTVYLNQESEVNGDQRRMSKGWLYFDDGETFNFQKQNELQITTFHFSPVTSTLEGTKLRQKYTYKTEYDYLAQLEILGFTD